METFLSSRPIKELTITIVGGGNAAHALGALLPYKGFNTHIWAPFGDEARLIKEGIEKSGGLTANFAEHNSITGLISGTPSSVSADPAKVIPESDVLLLPLPSFAYVDVFTKIKPYIRPGMAIGITPGQGGVDWAAAQVLGEKLNGVTLFSIMPMPFNCRINRYGESVEVQELKRAYKIACSPVSQSSFVISLCEELFDKTESCGSMLSASLYPINAVIHPSRLYELTKDYQQGSVLAENPFFYEGMTTTTADYMNRINNEIIAVSEQLQQVGFDVDIPHIKDFLASYVYNDSASSLDEFFANNPAYKGFQCPFKSVEGGFVPDFNNRYFTEDIPLGLCITKGVAELVDVKTPFIDEIITWAQYHMGKEYLNNGRLTGKDLGETHAPQRFGITTLDGLLAFYL
ncbi:hypothetical protein VIN01S_03840 [Vibrio inusitatus NBRC 102082]|uniref:Opine dehydrogenase domain-containing protein n=1 Tax=Vibrio inusitatus NBRC 102082 TaxID=1219070 RepID=A0A4Y3HS21_9VIBR|nr:NAD/NADP octopine/nopaline dehydrogenase family protein [Vibrio inusitatus]GEA49580.1 hypothetical protein VIN01S_03840 [Vibrio inusitatus NBRC 102082]